MVEIRGKNYVEKMVNKRKVWQKSINGSLKFFDRNFGSFENAKFCPKFAKIHFLQKTHFINENFRAIFATKINFADFGVFLKKMGDFAKK